MSESTPISPRRRWFSLSLRALMLLILMVGGLMGWRARRASIQRRAVASVERLRGSVAYDWQYSGNAYLTRPAASPPGPTWLRQMLGDEYFQEVAQVNLPAQIEFGPEMGNGIDALGRWAEANNTFREKFVKPLDDDQLACLDGLDRLECVVIQWSGKLRPEGLERLERLGRLKELHVGMMLDGEVTARLGRLTGLETLIVSVDWQSESDLAFLGRMAKLRSLAVGGPITDANMAQIARAGRLESLTVTGSNLTDAGLAHLDRLKSLKYLFVMGGSGITDRGLAHLKGLSHLENLSLIGTPVDEGGLEHIGALPRLANLVFTKGRIDDGKLAEFRAAKPGLSVSLSP